jgi:hypothetical protein
METGILTCRLYRWHGMIQAEDMLQIKHDSERS